MSYNAFLFSLSNKQGTDPVLFPLKSDKRYTAHPVKPGQGPIFGNGDLVLETMSSGYSELGNSFGTTADAAFLLAEANNFVISDVEVLYKGGNYGNNKLQLRSKSRSNSSFSVSILSITFSNSLNICGLRHRGILLG